MILVAEYELQRVLAGRKLDLRFGLPGAEVKVVEVVRDRLIEWRQRHIDEDVMMSGVLPVRTRGRDAHATQTEMNHGPGANCGAVLQINKVDQGAWRGWRGSTGLRKRRQCNESKAPENEDCRK